MELTPQDGKVEGWKTIYLKHLGPIILGVKTIYA